MLSNRASQKTQHPPPPSRHVHKPVAYSKGGASSAASAAVSSRVSSKSYEKSSRGGGGASAAASAAPRVEVNTPLRAFIAQRTREIAAARQRMENEGGGPIAMDTDAFSQAQSQAAAAAAAAAARSRGVKRKAVHVTPVIGSLPAVVHTQPTDFCSIMKSNCARVNAPRGMVMLANWDIHFPAFAFNNNPVSFMSLTGTYDSALDNLRLLFLVGQIVNNAVKHETEKIKTRDDITKETVEKVVTIKKNVVTVVWERVPHKDNPRRYVSYSLRLTEWGYGNVSPEHDTVGLAAQMRKLIESNDLAEDKIRSHSGSAFVKSGGGVATSYFDPVDPEHFRHVTQVKWRKIARCYNPQKLANTSEADALPLDFMDQRCLYTPQQLFKHSHTIRMRMNLDAHPDYCNPANYAHVNNMSYITFPQGGVNAWQIRPDDLDPLTLARRYLPSVKVDSNNFRPARANFAKMHGLSEEQVDEVYNAVANRTSTMVEANDMDALTRRIRAEDKELRRKHAVYHAANARVNVNHLAGKQDRAKAYDDDDDDLARLDVHKAYYAERLHLAKTDWLPAFQTIFSTTGDCPTAIKALASYKDQYVTQNKTMSAPQASKFGNLSRQSNMLAADAAVLKDVMGVFTAQEDCILFLIAALHVYSRVDMNPHQGQIGPGGVGKSFALKILTLLLIAETFRELTYATLRAFAVPGKQNACLIMIMEDAQATTFGVKSGAGRVSQASTDAENMMKQFLTSPFISVQTLGMEPQRHGQFIKSETSCILFFNMNEVLENFPEAMRDRFCMTEVGERVGVEGGITPEMMAKDARIKDPVVKSATATIASIWNRRQMLIAYVLYLESCGILRQIDLSVADAYFSLTAKLAKRHHMDMTKKRRNIDRYRMYVRVLAAMDAIDALWDAPGSPLHNVPHKDEHFLLIDKYLYSTVGHAAFAMGLAARMWQDGTRACIQEAMISTWFGDAQKRIDEFELLKEFPRMPEEIEASKRLQQEKEGIRPRMPEAPRAIMPDRPPGLAITPRDKQLHQEADIREYFKKKHEYDAVTDDLDKWWAHCTVYMGEGKPISAVPGASQRVPTKEEVLVHLARKISPHLKGQKFLEGEVVSKLRIMTESSVQVNRPRVDELNKPLPDEVSDVPVLVVEQDHIRFAIPIIQQFLKHKNNALFLCAQDACSVIAHCTNDAVDSGTVLLYGETEKDPGMRHIWRTIKPDPTIANRPDFALLIKDLQRITNTGYTSVVDRAVTQSMLDSADEYDDAQMNRLFGDKRPWSLMNKNLNEMGALKRAVELGLSVADMDEHTLPANPVKRAIKIADAEKKDGQQLLFLYPEDMPNANDKKHEDMWKGHYEHACARETSEGKSNPFLATTSYERLLAKQATMPSLYGPLDTFVRIAGDGDNGDYEMEEKKQQHQDMPALESVERIRLASSSAAAAAAAEKMRKQRMMGRAEDQDDDDYDDDDDDNARIEQELEAAGGGCDYPSDDDE